MLEDAETKEKLHLYEQQLELCNRQAHEREVFNSEIRQFWYDMNYHPAVLLGMIQDGDSGYAESYINSLIKAMGIYSLQGYKTLSPGA